MVKSIFDYSSVNVTLMLDYLKVCWVLLSIRYE